MILSVGFINILVQIISRDDEFVYFYTTSTVAFLKADLNTACRQSKRFAKKNILSIAKVVTFEATPKLWGMEYLRKWCKERTH